MAKLQKLTDLTISGETYHLAANGDAHLVLPKGLDAYEKEFAIKVDLAEFLLVDAVKKVQDILNHLARLQRAHQASMDRATGAGKE